MSLSRTISLLLLLLVGCQTALSAESKILLRAGPIDTSTAYKTAIQSPDTDYYIMQFSGPIEEEWKRQVTLSGAVLLDYLPDFAFIVQTDSESLQNIKQLPFVRWVDRFLPEYKISPSLHQVKGHVTVNMQVFPGQPVSGITKAIVDTGGTVEAASDGHRGTIRARVPAQAIAALSRAKSVAWIEPYIEPKLTNNVARTITGVSGAWQDTGFYGNGQIVAVADTGLDNGVNNNTMSADFRGRIFKTYPLGRRNDWSDPEGHGTHVCGSVLGNGVLSGANPATHNYTSSFAGMAPEASLIIQSLSDKAGKLSGLPSNLNDLFGQVYTDGARIHTNSWGAAYMGVYTTLSQQVDQFLWNNKDMTILFSAGNSGKDVNANGVIDSDALDAPATAKNCITVGATENNRTTNAFRYGDGWPSDYSADPIKTDYIANNPLGMAAFSSRGPTDDGRIKPDICAPGTNIISARSHMSGTGILWGVYNNDYLYSGGTSMSTPVTAGAAALIRQYMMVSRGLNPTGALLKAAMLNSATDIYPGQYGTGAYKEIPAARPNNVEGWGRLDVKNAFQPISPSIPDFIDASGLTTGGSRQYNYTVTNINVPFRVTLTWTDYPGAVQAAKELVNDLDLVITAPGGQQYKGNNTTDRINNVETVDILSPVAGGYTVAVSAYNVPQGPQPYALAVLGGLEAPETVSTIHQARSKPDGTLISITGKVVTAGTEALGNHFYIEETDRSSGIKVSYTGSIVITGSKVSIVGRTASGGGEQRIDADSVTIISGNNPLPLTLGINGSNIGGTGVGQRHGLTNVGLLVRVWGKVISSGIDSITIDDGSGPLVVRTGTLNKPSIGSRISVTGISSTLSNQPLIKARFTSDIVTY